MMMYHHTAGGTMNNKMPLSQRIRPDVEAAPWVIEEIKNLETALSWFQGYNMLMGRPTSPETKPPQVFLSRRNLLSLLSKLDRAANDETTSLTIIKHDTVHPTYPQNYPHIIVTAVEDNDYYIDRAPGVVHPKDDPS